MKCEHIRACRFCPNKRLPSRELKKCGVFPDESGGGSVSGGSGRSPRSYPIVSGQKKLNTEM